MSTRLTAMTASAITTVVVHPNHSRLATKRPERINAMISWPSVLASQRFVLSDVIGHLG
jgi:hypothetical protein